MSFAYSFRDMATTVTKYTKLVIERKSSKVLMECAYCGGNGKKSGVCNICDGNGKIWKDVSNGDLYKCRYCGGNGKKSGVCKICKGTGVVVGKSPRIECEYCGGNGKKSGVCNNCSGFGTVYTGDLKEY